jgi:hypothetical protein
MNLKRMCITVTILLSSVMCIFSQEVQPDSAQTPNVQSAGESALEEEGDLIEAPLPQNPDTIKPAVAAQPVKPSVGADTVAVQTSDTALLIEEGEEDFFSNRASAAGSRDTAATNSSTNPAPAPDQIAPINNLYDRGSRFHSGRYGESTQPPPAQPGAVVEIPANSSVDSSSPAKPAIIESVHSINFAKNLHEYRSPRVAMFLSLLLPGLGQAYTKRYLKSAIFGAVEIGLIATSIKFAVDGKNQRIEAHTFADSLYKPDRFWQYYANLTTHLTNYASERTSNADSVKTIANELLSSIFIDTAEIRLNDRSRNTNYYSMLEQREYIHGWDDREPVLDTFGIFHIQESANQFGYNPVADSTWLFYLTDKTTGDTLKDKDQKVYGYSPNQKIYKEYLSESNSKYKLSKRFVMVLVVNHIVSAFDALLSAKLYNDQLLGKQSLLDHVNFNQSIAFSEGGIVSEVGIKVRF